MYVISPGSFNRDGLKPDDRMGHVVLEPANDVSDEVYTA